MCSSPDVPDPIPAPPPPEPKEISLNPKRKTQKDSRKRKKMGTLSLQVPLGGKDSETGLGGLKI